jgi:hypothetical protein
VHCDKELKRESKNKTNEREKKKMLTGNGIEWQSWKRKTMVTNPSKVCVASQNTVAEAA